MPLHGTRRCCALFAISALAASCSSAHITDVDAGGAADARIATDGSGDTGSPFDGGVPGDGARPPLPATPAAPVSPDRAPDILGRWLPGVESGALALADPITTDPAAPTFMCRSPWTGGGAEPCEPWPGGRRACDVGQEQFPGDFMCHDAPCPTTGTWAGMIPTTGTIYVRQGASGGDGTMTSPFGTIAEALVGAGSRTPPVVIALTAGTYSESVSLPAGWTLWGACPSQTEIRSVSGGAAITAGGPSTALRSLHVSSTAGHAIDVPAGTSMSLDSVRVLGAAGTGVSVLGGTLTARAFAIHDVTGNGAVALDARAGGHVDVTFAAISRMPGPNAIAVRASEEGSTGPDSTVVLRNVAIHNISGTGVAVGTWGAFTAEDLVIEQTFEGISGRSGGPIQITRGVIRNLMGDGVFTLHSNLVFDSVLIANVGGWAIRNAADSTITNTIIRDVGVFGPLGFREADGHGVLAWESRLMLDRVRMERVAGCGMTIWGHSTITATNLEVIDAGQGSRERYAGCGAQVTDGSSLELRASRITRPRFAGVLAGGCILGGCGIGTPPAPDERGRGVTATLIDVAITDTRPSADGVVTGWGLAVTGDARLNATRVVSSGNATGLAIGSAALGLDAYGIGGSGTATLDDVVLRGSVAGTTGLLAADGATVSGSGVVVSDVHGVGIESRLAGSSVTLADVVVGDIGAPSSPDAILATNGGSVALDHAWVLRPLGASLHALDMGAITVADSAIGPGNSGAHAESGALALTRVQVNEPAGSGIIATGASTVSLTDVAITGAAPSTAGFGLLVDRGAQATMAALSVTLARPGAVVASGRSSSLTGHDLTVRCAADPASGACAPVVVLAGASADVLRALISDARGLASGAYGGSSNLALHEATIMSTALGPCSDAMCATAVGAYDAATVTLEHFRIADVEGTGAQLDDSGARLLLDTGLVSDARNGVELPESIDPASVLRTTLLERCDTDISRTSGPRPTAPSVP